MMKKKYRILLLFLLGLNIWMILPYPEIQAQNNSKPQLTLHLTPGENNPRNSEGDFVKLKDGRILFVYSHFVGYSASDFGNSHLAARYSSDNGNTWTEADEIVVENEGTMNVKIGRASCRERAER